MSNVIEMTPQDQSVEEVDLLTLMASIDALDSKVDAIAAILEKLLRRTKAGAARFAPVPEKDEVTS